MNDFLSRLFWGDQKDDQPKPQGKKKRINLALQGGGAHGAFTWGVLDHLLDDGRLAVEGISGTSAGAVNAVMLADGLNRGGPEEARKRLADFWRAASLGGDLPAVQRAITDKLFALWPGDGSPTFNWLSAWSQQLSPYDVNPLNINPLKDLVERFVDFDGLRKDGRPIFIAATNVQTGKLHIFPKDKISAEARGRIESAITNLEDKLKEDDRSAIEAALKQLNEVAIDLGKAVYEASASQIGAGGAAAAPGPDASTETGHDDDVIDAEFEVKDEEKK